MKKTILCAALYSAAVAVLIAFGCGDNGVQNKSEKVGNFINMFRADKTLPDTTTPPYAHKITFNAGNGGTVNPKNGSTNEEGKLASLPEPTKIGYTFVGWFTAETDGTQVTAGPTGTVFDTDTMIYAQYSITTYNITYYLNGGSVSPNNPSTYTVEMDDILLTNPTKTDFSFRGWTEISSPDTMYTVLIATKNPTGDKSYTAHWLANTVHTSLVTVLSDGTGASGNSTHKAGDTVKIKAGTPPTGCLFKEWTFTKGVTLNRTNNNETWFIMPATDVTVAANFEYDGYTTLPGGNSPDGNLVVNSDFSKGSNGLSDWVLNTFENSAATASTENKSVTINITKLPNSTGNDNTVKAYNLAFVQAGLPLLKGYNYALSFYAYATAPRVIDVVFRKATSPWTNYYEWTDIQLGTQKNAFRLDFKMTEPNDIEAVIDFHLGQSMAGVTISNVSVYNTGCCRNYYLDKTTIPGSPKVAKP